MSNSRLPGFYKLSPDARRRAVGSAAQLHERDLAALEHDALPLSTANLMIENVIGTMALPLGVGVNFQINGRDVIVPMAVEEPSVVAAVSNMARLVRRAGGFSVDADPSVMIGQVQITDVANPAATRAILEANIPLLEEIAWRCHPRLVERGGGPRGMKVRDVVYDEPGEPVERMVVLHFYLDCVDAMGANMVNTVAEKLAPTIEALTGEQVGLRILSNLASRRLARARCALRPADLCADGMDGSAIAQGIASAYRFAWADPWRAATHNKGIMNGVDAVVVATGNDWRAIEAGAHAWAARDGQYRSLSTWKLDAEGTLHGALELPVQVGTVGGSLGTHPTAALNLKILGNPRAGDLAGILAAVGLAQNLGALRALATEGIQQGHMRMHARTIAAQAGAAGHEVELVVRRLCEEEDYSVHCARRILEGLRT